MLIMQPFPASSISTTYVVESKARIPKSIINHTSWIIVIKNFRTSFKLASQARENCDTSRVLILHNEIQYIAIYLY